MVVASLFRHFCSYDYDPDEVVFKHIPEMLITECSQKTEDARVDRDVKLTRMKIAEKKRLLLFYTI